MIYILLGCIFFAFAVLETDRGFRVYSKQGYRLAVVLMICLASLRSDVGTDWAAYLEFYRDVEQSSRVEFGYSHVNNIFSYMGIHYNVFLFVLACASLWLVNSFFRYFGASLVLTLFIFYSDLFLYLNLSGMRQAIAISLTCFALRYAVNRNLLAFAGFICLASSFHASALVFTIAYVIPRSKLTLQHWLWIGIVMLTAYKSLETVAAFITENTLKNAAYYLDGIEISDTLFSNFLTGSVRRVAVLAVVWLAWEELKERVHFVYLLNLYIVGVIAYAMLYTTSADMGVRLSAYFTVMDTVLLGTVAMCCGTLLKRLGITIFVSALCFQRLFGYASNPFYEYRLVF
jgi:EpsG family